ncbi:bifunctional isochorismate lyase/aryl carrier protein [Salibacterium salarium]|uniref:isochorismatase family protein n=1 Tax=Salibacterium salarium TaxID=284579 RepID=UPI00278462AA|nr:isochorismatase family protein [Salibacterium salarium]MDQ0297940.1 bifunctional isochorismate lyase/aryl carrier protein [Salibacterium salarium]
MAIPTIAPYRMPLVEEYPENKVLWEPDPYRCVLLIHDMQQYFIDPFTSGASPLKELLNNIQSLKSYCTAMRIPIIFSAQPNEQTAEQRGLLQDFWGVGIERDEDQDIIQELTPSNNDTILTKWRYSAFQKTNLFETLQQYGRDQIIICGVYAHIGCLLTATDAFMKDIQPFLVGDALADFSSEYHQMALNYAANRCAMTTSTQNLLQQLRTRTETEPEEKGLTEQYVREQVAQLLQVPALEMGLEENLIEKGLDSIRMMSLVEKWRKIGANVSFIELAESPTISAWWRLLANRIEETASIKRS